MKKSQDKQIRAKDTILGANLTLEENVTQVPWALKKV